MVLDRKPENHSSYGGFANSRLVEVCSVCPMSIPHIPGSSDSDRVPDLQCAVNPVLLTYLEGLLGATRAGRQSCTI